MVPGRKILVLLAALLGWLMPAMALAAPIEGMRLCHAAAAIGESYDAVAARASRWSCNPGGWDIAADSTFLRFTLPESEDDLPRSFVTHAVRFEKIAISVIDADGARRTIDYTLPEAHHLEAAPLMSMALPDVTPRTREVVVRIDRPWVKAIFAEAGLDSAPEGTGWPLWRVAALGIVCGMLLVPLLLNLAFYSVLPERFVVWHLVMVVAMLAQTAIGTGFIHLVMTIHDPAEAIISNLCYAAMAAAALMFAANFLETECLDPRLRAFMRRAAVAVAVVGLITTSQAPFMRVWSTMLVHLNMLFPLGLVSLALYDAWRKGSRMVIYPLLGWTPAMGVGLLRVVTYILPGSATPDVSVLYSFALAIEVIVTAVGIVGRFILLRQERDSAMIRAEEMEGIVGRDPLTGLNNRLSIERRFDELLSAGFRAMAVIDLDHFKDVNDTHGHATGDAVLKATARAIAGDRDTHAIRMGGEEFMLLLRGPFAAERAERARRAITARVAAEVAGLDRIVTASMGLAEYDGDNPDLAAFDSLYAHCDRLLYEAKRSGRNRTVRDLLAREPAEPLTQAVSI